MQSVFQHFLKKSLIERDKLLKVPYNLKSPYFGVKFELFYPPNGLFCYFLHIFVKFTFFFI